MLKNSEQAAIIWMIRVYNIINIGVIISYHLIFIKSLDSTPQCIWLK